MFLGEYRHSIDEKGRVTVPARYRQLLEGGAYITHGFDRNLMVLQSDTFEAFTERLNLMSITDAQVRKLRRLLLARAENVQPDGSGRILLPVFLREAVELEGEVVLIGGGNFFELWSPENWAQQQDELDDAQEDANYFSALELFASGGGE